MSDIINQNFEHTAFEADIKRLSNEIAEKKKLLEYKNLSSKELVRQTIQPIIQQAVIQSQAVVQQTSNIEKDIFPEYFKNSSDDAKIQVEKLIDLTLHHGIEKAVKVAVKSNAFILDAFHDALMEKFHEELKKRKIID